VKIHNVCGGGGGGVSCSRLILFSNLFFLIPVFVHFEES
jgi:hypothetical protein